MNPERNNYFRVHKLWLLVAFLVIGAGLVGWWLGRSDSQPSSSPESSTQPAAETEDSDGSTDVKSIVRYSLPDGWKENSCEGSNNVYITPDGTNANCNTTPIAPIKLSVDSANNKDCNQLQNVSNVKRHVCVSEYISGKKALKASTTHLASSSYGQETTVDAYYIDTGKGVVKVEYIHTTNGELQAAFDELAKSVTVK